MIKLIESKFLLEKNKISSNDELVDLLDKLKVNYFDSGANDVTPGEGRYAITKTNILAPHQLGWYPELQIWELDDENDEVYGVLNIRTNELYRQEKSKIYSNLKAAGITPRRIGILSQYMDLYTEDGENLIDVLDWISKRSDDAYTDGYGDPFEKKSNKYQETIDEFKSYMKSHGAQVENIEPIVKNGRELLYIAYGDGMNIALSVGPSRELVLVVEIDNHKIKNFYDNDINNFLKKMEDSGYTTDLLRGLEDDLGIKTVVLGKAGSTLRRDYVGDGESFTSYVRRKQKGIPQSLTLKESKKFETPEDVEETLASMGVTDYYDFGENDEDEGRYVIGYDDRIEPVMYIFAPEDEYDHGDIILGVDTSSYKENYGDATGYLEHLKKYNLDFDKVKKLFTMVNNESPATFDSGDAVEFIDQMIDEYNSGSPSLAESRIQESGFKTVYYYNGKKVPVSKIEK